MPVLLSYKNIQLICCANQLAGYYMWATLPFNVLISRYEKQRYLEGTPAMKTNKGNYTISKTVIVK